MGDWSILGRFLTEVQNHSTVIGKIWLTMLLIFRILLVTLVGDAVYSDEQSKFTCNTLQPGCNNVCYDAFAPVSHLRFWVFQIVLVSTPSIFYIVYVLHKIAKDEKMEMEKARVHELLNHPSLVVEPHGSESFSPHSTYETEWSCVEQTLTGDEIKKVNKDPTKLPSTVLVIYIIHVVLRSLMEVVFLIGQYYLFGFAVPHLFRCETYPCPTTTDCFVSRATEKTIFLNFMFAVSLGCLILNVAELHYLGWIYIFQMLCSACSKCLKNEPSQYSQENPLLQQVRETLLEKLDLKTSCGLSPEKPNYALSLPTTISFESDSTAECTSKKSPDEKERDKSKLVNVAKKIRKSWL
ncbi:gap junction delta-2 protein [Erpetoichthys calabaricus]|uniref:gap junction delta-2 protein n=1 Tax=Erpetoichthys calabaricus TaxID=27687 RepID=UPI00109F0616|nr:gap junction delta-2 protein [Erpetoichthys calabaricus]